MIRDLVNKVFNSLRLALRHLYAFDRLFDLIEKTTYLSRIDVKNRDEYK